MSSSAPTIEPVHLVMEPGVRSEAPALGHLPTPLPSPAAKRPDGLIRQLSFELSKAEISNSSRAIAEACLRLLKNRGDEN